MLKRHSKIDISFQYFIVLMVIIKRPSFTRLTADPGTRTESLLMAQSGFSILELFWFQIRTFLFCYNYPTISSYRIRCKHSYSVKTLAIMSRSEKSLKPVFFKAKHTSLLTVLLLFIVNVCDGFSTLHHQPHQVKHFSRPQFRFPKVAPYSPSPSGINTVNGRRMATSISNEEGHQGRRDENKIRHNIKTWSSDFWFGFTHVHNHYLEL
jgi:hypothetical protein